MANFCPNCGAKVNPDDKFCKNCGATLTKPVEVPKEKPETPPNFVQTPKKTGPAWTYTITNILGVLISLSIVFLVLYSLGCAMGMFPNTQDRMCQSIRQAFKGGGSRYGAPCISDGKTGLYGTDGSCYTCSEGTAVTNPTNNCSEGVAGVYCCRGGGTSGGGGKGCVPTGCPATAPWYGCGSCWETSNLCHTRGTTILTDDCSVCRKCP